jgi:hypothetical protein
MTAKQLPLADSPIRGYMMYSYHLAVTFSHVDAWPWFFCNFVQLQCNPQQLKLSDFLDYSTTTKGELHFTEGTSPFNPWLAKSPQLDFATIDALNGSIAHYVVDKLQRNFYVETFVDEYHLSVLFNGGSVHFRHRLLVFGYDDQRRTFDIAGFDKNSQYRKLECSYDELDSAFAGISPQIPDRTRLFKPDADAQPAAFFDRKRFVAVLGEYLASTNTLLNPDLRGDLSPESELWYGLKSYDFLREYITKWIANSAAGAAVDIDFRGFHTLWEHKKCMLHRMKWLAAVGFPISQPLFEQFARVQTLAESARDRVVMCRRGLLPYGKGHLAEIANQLDQARRIEADVLGELASIVAQHDLELDLARGGAPFSAGTRV